MRRNKLFSTGILLAAVAVVCCSCGKDKPFDNNIKKSVAVTSEPEVTATPKPVTPVGSYVFELSSAEFYVDDNKLLERVCFVEGKKVYGSDSGKVIGKVNGDTLSVTVYDSYTMKEVTLDWKKHGRVWKLTNKSWKYNRYRTLKLDGKYLLNVTEYYLVEDSRLFYVDSKKDTQDLGVKVFDAEKGWDFGASENFSMIQKKDKYKRVYYTDNLVNRGE